MGHPSKLTPEAQRTIINGIRAGMTNRLAAARAGIADSTFYHYLEMGRRQKRGKYKDFLDAVVRAEGECMANALAVLTKAAIGQGAVLDQDGRVVEEAIPADWRAAAFILERRFPHEFGRQVVETEMTVNSMNLAPEELEAKRDAVRRAMARDLGVPVDQLPSPRKVPQV